MIAIGFALGGTLVRAEAIEGEAFRRLCHELAGSNPAPDPALVDEAFAGEPDVLAAEGEALAPLLARLVSRVFRREPSPAVVAARFRQLAAGVAAECAEPLPGVARVLVELDRLAVPKAILTNGLSSVERAKASALQFAGKVLVSEEIGARKPSPAAFAALAREFALPVECIWYVGADQGTDTRPAAAVGMHPIERVDAVLDAIREPYSRSALSLRYIMRTALEWRPGHFVAPDEPPLRD
jgi:FMN phosphatase YigB (HAD superfamily)